MSEGNRNPATHHDVGEPPEEMDVGSSQLTSIIEGAEFVRSDRREDGYFELVVRLPRHHQAGIGGSKSSTLTCAYGDVFRLGMLHARRMAVQNAVMDHMHGLNAMLSGSSDMLVEDDDGEPI